MVRKSLDNIIITLLEEEEKKKQASESPHELKYFCSRLVAVP